MTEQAVVLTPSQIEFATEYISGFTLQHWEFTCAGQAASERRFVRLRCTVDGRCFILIVWNSRDEDWVRFLQMQQQLCPIVPYLPNIYAVDAPRGLILEEDLGSTTLKQAVLGMRSDTSRIEDIYAGVVTSLILWQSIDCPKVPVLTERAMDVEVLLWETDYFQRHCVTEFFGLERMLTPQWDEQRRLLAYSVAALPRVAMHRDFQSENIMITSRGIRYIDFQGARLGPAGYDVASLLCDPYVSDLSATLRDRLLSRYMASSPLTLTREHFRFCAMQRLMQALGAYTNLTLHKGKDWYRNFIGIALERLEEIAREGTDFPALCAIIEACRAQMPTTVFCQKTVF
jgi:aminoglycoside/choline kinase family phosphotransferase